MLEATSVAYPLIYTFSDVVTGCGFLARVTVRGRALAVDEGADDWWLYGVEPGGLAECGQTFHEAYLAFRQAFREVFFEFAAEAGDWDNFEAALSDFLGAINEPKADRWRRAVEDIQKGRFVPSVPFDSLRRVGAETTCGYLVERLDSALSQFAPTDNRVDVYFIPVPQAA
jgi:hypothetical protein